MGYYLEEELNYNQDRQPTKIFFGYILLWL